MEDELRQSQKRQPPKINSHKLPAAFGTQSKRKSKNQLVVKNNNIGNNQNSIKRLDDIVDIQEYKIAQNQLSPIKVNEKKVQKGNQMSTSSQQNNKNPIGPLRTYMKNHQKATEDINMQNDFNERVQQLGINNNQHNISNKNLLASKLKLEEMITLGIMKGSRHTGLIKKMLHAPTLHLYAVKEEPISNKEVRNNLKEWISFWQNNFQDSEFHTQIYGTFWNTPEGCVSILMEHLNGGSLQNLLESIGSLSERPIKEICQQVLGAIQQQHNKNHVAHGGITPSQILFNRDGKTKLSLGISNKVNPQTHQFHSLGKAQDRMSLYDSSQLQTPYLFNKQNPLEKQILKSSERELAEDLFKFGLVILISCIGNLEILDNHQQIFDNIRAIFEDQKKNHENFQNLCCIIHSEEYIMNYNRKDNQPYQPMISINTLLNQERISNDLIDFICQCTQIQPSKRKSIDQIVQHSFLLERNIPNKSPKVYLNQLIQISTQWTQQDILPIEYQGASEKQLNRLIDALALVLPNCEKWFTSSSYRQYTEHLTNLTVGSPLIDDIAKDLGIEAQVVHKKIMQAYHSVPFFQSFLANQQKKQNQIQQYR